MFNYALTFTICFFLRDAAWAFPGNWTDFSPCFSGSHCGSAKNKPRHSSYRQSTPSQDPGTFPNHYFSPVWHIQTALNKMSIPFRCPFKIQCLWSPSPCSPSTPVTSMCNSTMIKFSQIPPPVPPATRKRSWPLEPALIPFNMSPAQEQHTGTVVVWTLASSSHLCLMTEMTAKRLKKVLTVSVSPHTKVWKSSHTVPLHMWPT